MLYVPAAKTTIAQLGALAIVLCNVLWLMPLFTLMVGPPQLVGVGSPGPLTGPLIGPPEEVTLSEVCAVTDA